MMHLTGDEIFELAQLTEDGWQYSCLNLQQMEHLRTCRSCYEKFCSALAVMDVTSEGGYMVLSEIYSIDTESEKVFQGRRILAVVQVIREKIEDSVSAVMKQVEQAGSVFKFTPALAAAVRGGGRTDSEIFKIEDADDDRTFIVYDAGKKELMVQIHSTGLETENVKAYICFHNSEMIEVDLEKKGKYLKGVLGNISDNDFQIRIEYMD